MFVDFLTQARRKVVRDGGISFGEMQELGIPDAFISRLSNRLARDTAFVKACSFTPQGRRLNNFGLGSDPEFAFYDSYSRRKVNAASLGMKPALAAGCDQNQRLAELRCWPSTSAVEHVAGILASLRWMYRIYPSTRDYCWVAGAWCDNDGIGGHVHFGRKRPNRELEVAGLDGLATAFRQLEFFSNEDWDRRSAGDPIGQRYGRLGDIRPQLHGYEYRTLPSWLCSPQKAFTVVTASKLVVLDPDLTRGWIEAAPETAATRLKGLAAYFSGRDDDAWMLKHLLARVPLSYITQRAVDFKLNWGFQGNPAVTTSSSSILAACVEPTASEIKEIQDFLYSDTALGFVESAPTFKNTIPDNYYWPYKNVLSGINRSGFGDLMHDLKRKGHYKMCGIAGIRTYGNEPITQEEIKVLLCSLEERGNHATGIALMTRGHIHLCKDAKPAWAFVGDTTTQDFLDTFLTEETTMALLHTRFATTGNPKHNPNNHPIYNGHSAIVHNGSISNQLLIFSSDKLERSCETDSDILRAILDRDGLNETALKNMNRLSGSAAVAAFSEDDPDKLLLARSGSPLAYATTKDKLWWASTTKAIQQAVRPWTNHHGMPGRTPRADVSYFTMPDHTAYILSTDDKPLRREFKVCGYYTKPDYSRLTENYGTKMANFTAESRYTRRQAALPAPIVVETKPAVAPESVAFKIAPCPNLECGALMKILSREKFSDFHCPDCKTGLAPLDKLASSQLTWEN
ncbi:unnamed protein product [Sphagnum jensenii]